MPTENTQWEEIKINERVEPPCAPWKIEDRVRKKYELLDKNNVKTLILIDNI